MGPATVVASVLAVVIVQLVAVSVLSPLPEFLRNYGVPIVFTVVLVSAAVLVFAIVGRFARNPVRTYRRIALVVLIVSFAPDIPIGMGMTPGGTWPLAIVLMVMHVAAWAVTVPMLTRLTAATVR